MKHLLTLIGVIILIQAAVYGTTVGPQFPAAVFNDTAGWVNTGNASASDSVYTTYAASSSTGLTNDLASNTFDFSAIQAGSTVNGIQIAVIAKATTAGVFNDGVATFCNNLGAICTDKTLGTGVATTNTTFNYGTTSDTWGGMTLADVQNSGSTFYWAGNKLTTATSKTLSVDSVSETVTYTFKKHRFGLMGIGHARPDDKPTVRPIWRMRLDTGETTLATKDTLTRIVSEDQSFHRLPILNVVPLDPLRLHRLKSAA